MKANAIVPGVIAGLVLIALVLGIAVSPSASVAAPVAAPTPVAAGKAPSGNVPQVVTLIDAVSTVDDTTGPCVFVADYEKADI